MDNIDLSKAKIGDKFRTRDGQIVEYVCKYQSDIADSYILKDESNCEFYYHKKGNFLLFKESDYDLIEQVFDETLSAIERIERDERINRDMQKFVEDEENQELQRRQEVLKYADMLFFNQEDTRIALFGYDVAIETAEIIVKSRDKYLKDGKL